MITIEAPGRVRTFLIYFQRGDYIVEKLIELLKREGADAGLILAGVGSFDIIKLHTITKTTLPSQDRFFTLEGPIEVGSIQGSIAGGEPHIHVVVDDVANNKVYVGHLEPGTRVCYRAELGVMLFEGVKTKRVTNPETHLVDVLPVEG